MLLKISQGPKIVWTTHSKMKMRQYQLSERKVLQIFRKPGRIEEGIAPKTIAAMQASGTKKHPTEIWMMYQFKKDNLQNLSASDNLGGQIRIISAWRYPGRTPVGRKPLIPLDVLEELERAEKF